MRRSDGGELEPVQRALPRQRLFDRTLAGQHRQQRVVAQLLVVVQVLIAQGQTVDALRQHLRKLMLDPLRLARIGEAARHAPQQSDLAIRLSQQQRAALGRQLCPPKLPDHLPRKMRFKWELRLATLCHRKGRLSPDTNYVSTTQLCPRMRPFSTPNHPILFTSGEKSGLGEQVREKQAAELFSKTISKTTGPKMRAHHAVLGP